LLIKTEVSNAGQPILLAGSDITEGTSVNDRIGDKISLESLYLNYTFNMQLSALTPNDNTNFCRLIIFQWKDNVTATDPNTGLILKNPTNFNSVYSHANSQSYNILFDKIVGLGQDSNQTFVGKVMINSKSRKMNKSIVFNGTIPMKNAIYFIALSDSSAATHPILVLNSRVYFTDK